MSDTGIGTGSELVEDRDEEGRRRRRRPSRVGPVLDRVLETMGLRERLDRAATAARWDEVVGPHVSRVTRARGCRGGTLFVEVAGAAWMTELNMMRRKLLERLNEGRDRGRIERIVLLQSDGGSTVSPERDRKPRGRG